MRFRRLILLLTCTWGLVACQNFLSRWSNAPDTQAETLVKAGDYQGAMRRYAQLALIRSNSDHYWLLAADSGLRSGDDASAREMARSIKPKELNREDLIQYTLLSSRLDLNEGNAKNAMAKLDSIQQEKLEPSTALNYHTLRASAYNQMGNMFDSAAERVLLSPLLKQPNEIQRNNQLILDSLGHLTDTTLAAKETPPPDTLGGWVSLARILKLSSQNKAMALAKWQDQFSKHPANGSLLDALLINESSARTPKKRPKENAGAKPIPEAPFVGVLLPLTGSFAQAAQTVKAGILAAYEADDSPTKKPIYFEDTSAGDISQHYELLASNNPSVIIGPLVKEEVASLGKHLPLKTAVLALNQVIGLENEKIIQFGLTPEQEVEQVAILARGDGKEAAMILASDTSFGQRLSKHFEEYWIKLGGKITLSRKFSQHGGNYGNVVKELTGSNPSGDQLLFLASDPTDAREIMPKVSALSPQGIQTPVYATSYSFDIRNHSKSLQELNGMIFCDMPWVLNQTDHGKLSFLSLENQTSAIPSDSLKLFAMGMDAYLLSGDMDRVLSEPDYRLSGTTGILSTQPNHRIRRQLECSQVLARGLQKRIMPK